MMNWQFARQIGVAKFLQRSLVRQFYKRVLNEDLPLRLPNGRIFYVPPWDPSSAEVYLTGASMDFGVEAIMAAHLSPDGLLIDVGAHCGYYSAYMAHAVAGTIAIEPNQKCIPCLEKNTAGINRRVLNCFAGSLDEAVAYQTSDKGFAYMTSPRTRYDSFYGKLEPARSQMACITIDTIADQISITGIKIDVDGPDIDVLRGARKTIERCQPLIAIERNPAPGEELMRICKTMNYRVFAPVVSGTDSVFREITSSAIAGHTKMVLLVPERLGPVFENISSASPR